MAYVSQEQDIMGYLYSNLIMRFLTATFNFPIYLFYYDLRLRKLVIFPVLQTIIQKCEGLHRRDKKPC